MIEKHNEGLTPPMQNEFGVEIYLHEDPNSIPFYRFAVACLTEEEDIEILVTHPGQAPVEDGELVTEDITQTYQVRVPYTEMVDGVPTTKLRTEHRTRQVQVEINRPKEMDGNPDWKQESYTVSIPYTELSDNGTSVRRARLETRTRIVSREPNVERFVPIRKEVNYSIEKVSCFSTSGEPLDTDEVRKRLTVPIPVLILNDARHLSDYFGEILQPKSMIIVLPPRQTG